MAVYYVQASVLHTGQCTIQASVLYRPVSVLYTGSCTTSMYICFHCGVALQATGKKPLFLSKSALQFALLNGDLEHPLVTYRSLPYTTPLWHSITDKWKTDRQMPNEFVLSLFEKPTLHIYGKRDGLNKAGTYPVIMVLIIWYSPHASVYEENKWPTNTIQTCDSPHWWHWTSPHYWWKIRNLMW